MTKEQIEQAFEGRWRIKSQRLDEALEMMLIEYRLDYVKKLCRDFFETGITIGQLGNENDTHGICNGGIVREDEVLLAEEAIDMQNTAFYKAYSFDAFWEAYEKKVGRPKCEKLWEKLSNQDKIECMAYIPRYKQAQPDKQYRKNPETFLRNKSWNDELIFRNDDAGNRAKQQLDKLTDILTT